MSFILFMVFGANDYTLRGLWMVRIQSRLAELKAFEHNGLRQEAAGQEQAKKACPC